MTPRNTRIDPDQLALMVEHGIPYREIAEYFGVTVSGVQQAVERLGLQRPTLSHKKFLPWRVGNEHKHSGPATALRHLSMVAQGKPIPIVKLNSALRWANRLYRDGLDIDYDRNRGFYERTATNPWHIEMVLADVRKAMDKVYPRL